MKKTNNKMIVIFLVIGLSLFYALSQGWFNNLINFSITNQLPSQAIQNQLTNTDAGTCTLSLTPQAVFSGDSVTGIIQDGANTPCNVYATDGSGWRLIYTGVTDSSGRLSSTQAIEITGTFTFRAICGSCTTNNAILYVNELPDDEEDSCTDSDGKNQYTPGWVVAGLYYYDDCAGNWAVKEYYCEGNTVKEQVMTCNPGYICYETRSGDYCKTTSSPPADSDGDGYSDIEETEAGSNPNDPLSYPGGGPSELCSNHCMDIGYHGSTTHDSAQSLIKCAADAQSFCTSEGLEYEASTWASLNSCCCYECSGW